MPEGDVTQRFKNNFLDAATFPDGRPKQILRARVQLRIPNSQRKLEAGTGSGLILDKQVPCLPPCRTAVPLRRVRASGVGHPIKLHGRPLQRAHTKTIHEVVPATHSCCEDDHAWIQCEATCPVYAVKVERSAKQLFITFEGDGQQAIHRFKFAQNGQLLVAKPGEKTRYNNKESKYHGHMFAPEEMPFAQVIYWLEDGTTVFLHDPQNMGHIEIVPVEVILARQPDFAAELETWMVRFKKQHTVSMDAGRETHSFTIQSYNEDSEKLTVKTLTRLEIMPVVVFLLRAFEFWGRYHTDEGLAFAGIPPFCPASLLFENDVKVLLLGRYWRNVWAVIDCVGQQCPVRAAIYTQAGAVWFKKDTVEVVPRKKWKDLNWDPLLQQAAADMSQEEALAAGRKLVRKRVVAEDGTEEVQESYRFDHPIADSVFLRAGAAPGPLFSTARYGFLRVAKFRGDLKMGPDQGFREDVFCPDIEGLAADPLLVRQRRQTTAISEAADLPHISNWLDVERLLVDKPLVVAKRKRGRPAKQAASVRADGKKGGGRPTTGAVDKSSFPPPGLFQPAVDVSHLMVPPGLPLPKKAAKKRAAAAGTAARDSSSSDRVQEEGTPPRKRRSRGRSAK